MKTLEDIEKLINSELTSKINNSKINHWQIYLNIDESNILDVILLVEEILNSESLNYASEYDINQDSIINILDVIDVVGEILGLTFRVSVELLMENFPELEVERRLQELDKSIYFTKWRRKEEWRRTNWLHPNGTVVAVVCIYIIIMLL